MLFTRELKSTKMNIKMLIVTVLILFFSAQLCANTIHTEFPDKINPNENYVFYSHGFIVEGTNPIPENPKWGVYDFPAIKLALADGNHNLIAYHREKGTDPQKFAKLLAKDAINLIENGVKPNNITFVGFSRGGAITVLTSNYLALDDVNFVILAGCGRLIKNSSSVKIYGNVYSMFETSDSVGSCQFLADRSGDVQSFTESSISTGKDHGAFYKPLSEWIVPVKAWIKSRPGTSQK